MSEVSQEDMKKNIQSLNKILEKVRELNRKNERLKDKYRKDDKYARIHKRLSERGDISKQEIFDALMSIKESADEQVLKNTKILDNEEYFDKAMVRLVIEAFKKNQKLPLSAEALKYINGLVVKEYMNEFNGVVGW